MSVDACEFCEIVRGEAPAKIVSETEQTLAFFPLNPATLGHTLLIPKQHVATLWELEPDLAVALARALLPLAHAIRTALTPDGFNVINSAGEAASQSVFHLHIHLVPRWFDDHVGEIWPPKTDWARGEEDTALASVREALASFGSVPGDGS
jgi:histidine triad (HIT) family protein